ncbi:MAG: flagellar basal body-associated FliL family protein [Rhodocyclaceae bacterium]|jgi:flagellar FliL protein|nr:flagellar basal body-associated FliL family protein [Rhodocyclaceae bacterium]
MADAKKTEAPAEGEAPKKKSKLLLIIIITVLVLVLGGGAAAFFLMSKKASHDEEADTGDEPPAKVAKAKKKKKDPGAPPVFTKLDPFVVKLQSEAQEAYVQAVPELRLYDAAVGEQIKQFMPEIRHKVLLILAGKKASDLSTPEGMQVLANQIRVTINTTLTGEPPEPGIEKQDQAGEDAPVQAVFFSSLIVQ